ncbi:nitrile hydratase subunit beta [Pararhodobacter zhoushanensis]|uniref:nitrile hydratase subunit beta n=1 Tax=Pararhodobacter zhoushanensis TaxID=2479545 RepID=UPI000F8DB4E8|nr:nitrile hydratase subunit beta [Pararhodobacter zhoushanensis]
MNGPHDLGGKMGFGAVAPEANELLFHADWEARALGVVLACGALGKWTLDESRHARESLPPVVYYASSYYEIWTRALEVLLQRHDLLTAEELADGQAQTQDPHPKRLSPQAVPGALARGGPCDRPVATAPLFAPGDRVRCRNAHPRGHTRVPTYLAGHTGVVESEHGGFVLPDTNAHGQGEQPQRLYTVVFDGAEVWGPDSEPGLTISADLWEGYLERA